MTKANLIYLLLLTMPVAVSPAAAVPIVEVVELSSEDLTEISRIEQSFFDSIETNGFEYSAKKFAENGGGALTIEFAAETKKVDQFCGKITGAERIGQKNNGNRYTERRYATQHEKCVVFWVLDFSRNETGWDVRYFNFNTDMRKLGNG